MRRSRFDTLSPALHKCDRKLRQPRTKTNRKEGERNEQNILPEAETVSEDKQKSELNECYLKCDLLVCSFLQMLRCILVHAKSIPNEIEANKCICYTVPADS